MSDNEQSQKREEIANIDLEEKILKQIYVYGSLLEGKRHQSLVKPDKIKVLNELKRTELAKQKHGVNTIYANICVTFDMSSATPLQTALLYVFFKKKLFYRTQHIMPFCNNSVNQNRFEG